MIIISDMKNFYKKKEILHTCHPLIFMEVDFLGNKFIDPGEILGLLNAGVTHITTLVPPSTTILLGATFIIFLIFCREFHIFVICENIFCTPSIRTQVKLVPIFLKTNAKIAITRMRH